ncbi:MAG: hypothetical protein K0U52_09590 [Gammaproteobacteria bacterium]|nr:hypothetical protein [Gammaproteobacteria bacterium]
MAGSNSPIDGLPNWLFYFMIFMVVVIIALAIVLIVQYFNTTTGNHVVNVVTEKCMPSAILTLPAAGVTQMTTCTNEYIKVLDDLVGVTFTTRPNEPLMAPTIVTSAGNVLSKETQLKLIDALAPKNSDLKIIGAGLQSGSNQTYTFFTVTGSITDYTTVSHTAGDAALSVSYPYREFPNTGNTCNPQPSGAEVPLPSWWPTLP